MAVTGIAKSVQATLTDLDRAGSDSATRSQLRELGGELLELAQAVERLSVELDRIADGRWGLGPPRS